MKPEDLAQSLLDVDDEALDEWLDRHRSQLNAELVNRLKDLAEEQGYGGDLAGALRILERAARVCEAIDDRLAMALVWRGRANVLHMAERFEESTAAAHCAVALYEAHGSPFDVAVARTVEVVNLAALERFEEAIALAQWIRPHFDRANFLLGQAMLASNLGKVHTMAWQFEDALRQYRRARRLFFKVDPPQPIQQATILHNMGVATHRLDRFSLAERYYTRAYPALIEVNEPFTAVKAQFNLARLYLGQGRLEKALERLAQARVDAVRLTDSPDVAYVDLYEAQVRHMLGQKEQAHKLLRRSLSSFEQLDRRIEIALALMELSHLLAEQNTPSSLAEGLLHLERVEERLHSLDIPLLMVWVKLKQGEFLLRLERLAEAAERAEIAYTAFAVAGLILRQSQARALLADCCWRTRPARAQQLYQAALDDVEKDEPLLAARCWRGLGRLAANGGDGEAAEQAYERAVDLLDMVRRSLHGHSHQAGFLEDRQALFEELLAALHMQASSQQRVLAWVERFKAQALADLLVKQPPDSAVDAQLRSLLAERERLREQLDHRLLSLAKESNAQIAHAQHRARSLAAHDTFQTRALGDIRQRLQTLDEHIARQRDVTYDWRRGATIEPARVHDLLDPQTVLVSYYAVHDWLYALTVTQAEGDIQIHPLRSRLSDVEQHWQRARRMVARPASRLGDVQERLARLHRSLIEPLESRLQDKQRLLILPHRGLFHVPFAALYDSSSGQHLVERWTLQLAPSATVLERCHRRERGGRPPLLVGYPGKPSQPDYLPGVKQEIEALSGLWPDVDILLDDQATVSRVMAAMAGRSLVHLAGHVIYDWQNPLDSGVPLADDRCLRASDLYLRHGHLDGAMVALSGCESGRGRLTGGDVLGLISAFLYAGAVGVVAGLWLVDDAATARLMTAFYRNLAAGADAATALRQAQLSLLRSDQHAHPYFWAAFGLSGQSGQ